MAGYITTLQDHDSPCIPEHWGRPHNTKVARDNVPDNPLETFVLCGVSEVMYAETWRASAPCIGVR